MLLARRRAFHIGVQDLQSWNGGRSRSSVDPRGCRQLFAQRANVAVAVPQSQRRSVGAHSRVTESYAQALESHYSWHGVFVRGQLLDYHDSFLGCEVASRVPLCYEKWISKLKNGCCNVTKLFIETQKVKSVLSLAKVIKRVLMRLLQSFLLLCELLFGADLFRRQTFEFDLNLRVCNRF